MSHLTEAAQSIAIPCKNLKHFKAALAKQCPTLEFVEGQNTYRTWKADHGKLVGDWPVTEGMTEADVGVNADHVIRVTEARKAELKGRNPYEIGMIRARMEKQPDGSEKPVIDKEGDHWILLTDFYGQANGLMNEEGVGKYRSSKGPNGERIDHSFELLYQAYVKEVTEKTAKKGGDNMPPWTPKAIKQLEKDTGRKVVGLKNKKRWAELDDGSIVGYTEKKDDGMEMHGVV